MLRHRLRTRLAPLLALVAGCRGSDRTTAPTPTNDVVRLVIEQQPALVAQSGVPLRIAPVLVLQTAAGAPATVAGQVVTVELGSGEGTLVGPRARTTDAFGRVTFDSLTFTGRVGLRTLRFTAANIGDVRSAAIRLDPGLPATLTIVGGDAQVAPVARAVRVAPSVRVQDASGNAVPDAVVRWRVLTGDGAVARTTDVTDSTGLATVGSWTLGPALVDNRLEARIDGARVEFVAQSIGHQAEGVSVGAEHRCTLAADGRAACWGRNSDGQLGDGSYLDRATPTSVAGNLTFSTLATAAQSTCGLTREAALFCWGSTRFLGVPTVGDPSRPARVPFIAAPVALASSGGAEHLCAIVLDGSSWCWGANASGEIGDGTRAPTRAPVRVNTTVRFTRISTGAGRSCALTADDAAWCWGSNEFGGLGDGTTTDRLTPVAVGGGRRFRSISVGGLATCGITTANELFCWGQLVGDGTLTTRTTPTPIALERRFTQVSAGLEQVCAIDTDGRLLCWGDTVIANGNPDGLVQLVPSAVDDTRRWRTVGSGAEGSCAIDRAGQVWCWDALWLGSPGGARPLRAILP